MSGVFTRRYHSGAGEADSFGVVRSSSLLNFLQDAATEHVENMNFSREDLIESNGAVWILVKIAFYLSSPVLYRQNIEIDTWHRGTHGISYYRDFDIRVEGRHIGHAVSAWVVASPETMKVLRPASLTHIPSAPADRLKYDTILSKLPEPEACRHSGSRTIRYSELDINNHLNNVRYADLICDTLDIHEMSPCYVNSMQINYNAQCKAGEEILLYTGALPGNVYSVTGKDATGARRFESRLSLTDL